MVKPQQRAENDDEGKRNNFERNLSLNARKFNCLAG
jgi:hypothetical protein